MNTIKKVVWASLIGVTIFIVLIHIFPYGHIPETTKNILEMLHLLIIPFGTILGILYGYPLLKNRLIEAHILKQFDKVQKYNNKVRIEAVRLMETFNPLSQYGNLQNEDITYALQQITYLYELSVGANQEVYTYIYLLKNTIKEYERLFQRHTQNFPIQINNFWSFLYKHLKEIQKFAGTINEIPDESSLKTNHIITQKLDPYLTNNSYKEISGLEHSLNIYATSAILLLYISKTLNIPDDRLLYLAAYKVAPSPAPIVRYMYHKAIYAPPILQLNEETVIDKFFGKMILNLIGVRYKTSINFAGEETHFTILYYANITVGKFVEGCIEDKKDFDKYKDIYIETAGFSQLECKNFEKKEPEMIIIEIKTEILKDVFECNKSLIEEKMKKETR